MNPVITYLSITYYNYKLLYYIVYCFAAVSCYILLLLSVLFLIWYVVYYMLLLEYVAVVIKSTIPHSPLGEDTVLFFQDRKPLGQVGCSFSIQNGCELD